MLNLRTSDLFVKSVPLTGKAAMLEAIKKNGFNVGDQFYIGIQVHKEEEDYYNWYLATLRTDDVSIQKTKNEVVFGVKVRKTLGRVIKDGYEELLEQGLTGSNIFFKPMFLKDGIGNANFQYAFSVQVERDVDSAQEQYDRYIEFFNRSGLMPSLVVYSGSKSLHIYFAFSEALNDEQKKFLAAYLTTMLDSDRAMVKVSQPIRLPGMKRIKNGKEVDVAIIHSTEYKYSFEEFKQGCDKAWLYAEEFDLTRYSEYYRIKNKLSKDPNYLGLDSAEEIFNLPAIEIQRLFKSVTRTKGNSLLNNGKSTNPWVNMLYNECLEALYRMSVEDMFGLSGYQYNFFRQGDKLIGKNPHSLTNHTRGSFHIRISDRAWYSHATDEGGFIIPHLMEQWFNNDNLRGQDFINFVKRLCRELGLDSEELYKKYDVPDYMIEAREVLELEENNTSDPIPSLNPSTSLSLATPKEDFSESSKAYSRKYLGIVLGSSELAQQLAEKNNFAVLAIKVFKDSLKAELERIISDSGVEPTIRVFVQDGDISKATGIYSFNRINAFCEEKGLKCKFTVKDCLKVDIKSSDWFNFEKIENTYYALKAKAGRASVSKQLDSCSKNPDFIFDAEYVSEGMPENLAPKKVHAISAAIGGGKTEYLADVICQYWKENSNGFVFLAGYRNGLLKSIIKRIHKKAQAKGLNQTILHIVDAEEEVNYSQISGASACHDSLLKIPLEKFRGAFLAADEIEAQLKHIFTSTTLEENRGAIIQKFIEIVRLVYETGKILIMEAELTDMTFDFFSKACDIPLEDILLYQNTRRKLTMDVEVMSKRYAALSRGKKAVEKGKKVIFPFASIDGATDFYNVMIKKFPNKKGLLITRDTANGEEQRLFLEDPKKAIDTFKYSYVIYSPTWESGGDISFEYFDEMCFVMTYLETRAQLQMLGRVRTNIPRYGYVKEAAKFDLSNRSFDIAAIREDFFKNYENSLKLIKMYRADEEVETSAYTHIYKAEHDEESAEYQIMELSCKFQVRENCAMADMRDNFVKALVKRGHTVKLEEVDDDKLLKEELKEAREIVTLEKAEKWVAADTSTMNENLARRIMNSQTATEEQFIAAKKFTYEKKFPGFQFNTENCLEMFVKDKGKGYRNIINRFNATYVEEGLKEEIKKRLNVYSQPFVVLADDHISGQVGELIARTGVLEVAKLHCFYAETPEVVKVIEACRWLAKDLKRLLKITVTPKTRAIDLVGKLLAKIGYSITRDGTRLIDGKQHNIYALDFEDPAYDSGLALFSAMTRRYEELSSNVLLKSEEVSKVMQLELNDLNSMAETTILRSGNSRSNIVSNSDAKQGGEVVELRKTKSGVSYRSAEQLPDLEKWELYECIRLVMEAIEKRSKTALESLTTSFSHEIRQIAFTELEHDSDRLMIRRIMRGDFLETA